MRAYTSRAQIPLEDVAVTLTLPDQTAIAMRLTNDSGLTDTISISVPDLQESQSPDPSQRPFALVNLYARTENYEQIQAEDIQVFADTVTEQALEMIPLAELPGNWNRSITFHTPAQNL